MCTACGRGVGAKVSEVALAGKPRSIISVQKKKIGKYVCAGWESGSVEGLRGPLKHATPCLPRRRFGGGQEQEGLALVEAP